MSRMPYRILGQENLYKNYVSRYDSRWTGFFLEIGFYIDPYNTYE